MVIGMISGSIVQGFEAPCPQMTTLKLTGEENGLWTGISVGFDDLKTIADRFPNLGELHLTLEEVPARVKFHHRLLKLLTDNCVA